MATRTITRLYDSYSDARAAVAALEAAGYSHDDVSIIARDNDRTGSGVTTDRDGDTDATETGAGTGATIGTVLGGGAGILAGIGALAIPGVGPIVAAGWLVAALTGAGAGAAAGGLIGSLTGAGVDAADAETYSEGVNRGGSLVTVRVDESRASAAEAILDRHNAVDHVARGAEYRASGTMGTSSSNPPGTMLSRGVDDIAGTNVSGARPENETSRVVRVGPSSTTTGTSGMTGSDPLNTAGRPDGTPGNPSGTAATRAFDRAAGTNVSGAYPGQSDGTAANPSGTAAERAVDRTLGTDTSRRS